MKDELEKRKVATFNNYSAWETLRKEIIKNIEEKGSDADLKIHKEFDDKKWERVYQKI